MCGLTLAGNLLILVLLVQLHNEVMTFGLCLTELREPLYIVESTSHLTVSADFGIFTDKGGNRLTTELRVYRLTLRGYTCNVRQLYSPAWKSFAFATYTERLYAGFSNVVLIPVNLP